MDPDDKPYYGGKEYKCKIREKESFGYAVTIVDEKLQGWLPSKEAFEIGTEFVGTFVCIYQGRIMLNSKISRLHG